MDLTFMFLEESKCSMYCLWGKSVNVGGVSTFWDNSVDLVPIMFLDFKIIHSLAPMYWTPKDYTNTLSLSALKLYSGFLGAFYEALSSLTCLCLLRPKFHSKNEKIKT